MALGNETFRHIATNANAGLAAELGQKLARWASSGVASINKRVPTSGVKSEPFLQTACLFS